MASEPAVTRIGFLYNHYATHQVLHTAPVAFALSAMAPEVEVQVLSSSAEQLETARGIGARWPGHRVRFRRTRVPLWARAADPLVGRYSFVRKKAVLRANTPLFAELDGLVVPERTSLTLRRHADLSHLRLIQIPHGAGDRAAGYERCNADFDLILVAGEKCRERFVREAGVDQQRLKVIGYPKFDVHVNGAARELFPERRPTVLYNPHFDGRLSSWPRWGRAILDYFAGQSKFNLIFAPHVLLYTRVLRHGARPLGQYRRQGHMLIDTGSERSVDMTYTRAADIYLGDVSSQAYEFVRRPRPAVFLNAHGIDDWRRDDNYRHWRLGTVVDDLDDLGAALEAPLGPAHADCQRAMTAATFDDNGVPAAERGAAALLDYFGQRTVTLSRESRNGSTCPRA